MPRSRKNISLPGVEFVYDEVRSKLTEQMQSIESLDTKIGIVFIFVGSILIGVMTRANEPADGPVGALFFLSSVVLLAIAFAFTLVSFFTRRYKASPSPEKLGEMVSGTPENIQLALLSTLIEVYYHNARKLRIKILWLVAGLVITSLVVILALVAEFLRHLGGTTHA